MSPRLSEARNTKYHHQVSIMFVRDFDDWLQQQSANHSVWYLKRLSANDTLAAGSNQAGPYVPRDVLLKVLPEINRPAETNPDMRFGLTIDSHESSAAGSPRVRAVWYNNQLHGGTRNETRLTGFGGQQSPLLNAEQTGALVVFAFQSPDHRRPDEADPRCRVWICRNETEEDQLEQWAGVVEPGGWQVWSVDASWLALNRPGTGCRLSAEQIPVAWREEFPTGVEIIRKAIQLSPALAHDVDKRLLVRRECEYQIFQSIEQVRELPRIRAGFDSVDAFATHAQTVLQRRKSRAGRSLELHARQIFVESGLVENRDFQFQPKTENAKSPDYLFPNAMRYNDPNWPAHRLRMLAVKTTCRDRWRQVLNEADRIETKHLLTLQEGVSEAQFREMQADHLVLVVPAPLHPRYPASVRPHLLTLAQFIEEVKQL